MRTKNSKTITKSESYHMLRVKELPCSVCEWGGLTDKRKPEMHGMSKTRIYRIWKHMTKRCSDKAKGRHRREYFDRGIRVCNQWLSFTNFMSDMGLPDDDQSIDRIDNSKGYCPCNCRWADSKLQAKNRTTTHLITAFGKTKTIKEWSIYTGLSESLIRARRFRGFSSNDCVDINYTPKQERQKSIRSKNCAHCGTVFTPRIELVRRGQGLTCSRSCSMYFQHANRGKK